MKETKRIKTRILMRRDSSERWTESNPILAQGEIGYNITIKKCKIGDGVNHWNDLPFFALQESNYVEDEYDIEILNMLTELGYTSPLCDSNGSIIVDSTGSIITV